MKPLVTFVFTILMLSIVAKKPVFDSIKTYESASIHFKKKTQGLFDEKNKKYIVPISNVEIYELANGFYGIADPKTRLVQIIFHNEFYTFKTSWQTKQIILDKSLWLGNSVLLKTNTVPTLQMEKFLLVDGGLGYSACNEKLGSLPQKGFAGIYYVSNDLVILTNNQKWNAKDKCNKAYITDINIFRKVKKNIQIFTQQYNEFYVDSSNIFIANYQLDSNSITENYSNENEESLTRTYMKYDFNLKDLKKVAFNTDKELNIQHIDSLSSYFKNSEYENISIFFTISRHSELVSNFDKNKASSTLIYEIPNTLSIYDLNSEIIVIEASNGNKTFIEIDSTRKSQTKNIENSLDVTVNYINKDLLLIRWYGYETGQQSGLWNYTSKKWVIEPSKKVLHEFADHLISEIYNNHDEPTLTGYDIYDFNGKIIHQLDTTLTIEKLIKTLIKVDSVSIHENTVITYKNGKKGLVSTLFGSLFPTRILFEEYDEIMIASHSNLLMMIKDGQITFAKNHNYYLGSDLLNYLIKYDVNTKKVGFSIYPQDYMGGDFNTYDLQLILQKSASKTDQSEIQFSEGKHNFGYEKMENGNLIIHNVKMKEVHQMEQISEWGEPTDLDGDGYLDYQEYVIENISLTGVYSPQQKKWIINPTKNWVGEFNGNYLTSEYSNKDSMTYGLYDQNGNYVTQLFNSDNNISEHIKTLYSADSVADLSSTLFSVFTKNNYLVIDAELRKGTIEINQLYKNDYLMYHLNNNFNMENLFLCKNEKGYFYNWKNHQEGMDSIIRINFDHYIMTSARDGNYDYINLGDTLKYHFKEKSTVELINYLYEEGAYRSKLGKIKLDSIHTLIVNFSETQIDIIETYDENGEPTDLFYYQSQLGTFASGIYNDKNNKWDLLPKYEKIIPTDFGYTGVIREDRISRGDGDVSNSTPPVIVKNYAYDVFDHNFKLILQFDSENNPYSNPNNFKYLTSNVDYDTIYEQVYEHLGPQTIYARQIVNSKHFIYYNKEKGYGALSHWTENNWFTKSKNYFEAINYNPYFDCAIGVRSDSLFINDFSLKLIPQSTIEIFNNGGRNYHFNIRETLPNGVFEYTFDEENKKWVKKVTPIESSFGITDGIYIPPIASISIYENEIIINHLNGPIEEVTEGDMYVYNDYYEYITTSYHGKTSNDEVWKKINGQWKCVLNEGAISKCDKGYLLIKPLLSQTYFNSDTKETSQLVDNQLKPILFEKYTNPDSYYSLEKGYYFIVFKNENDSERKVVCFTPSGKVISDAFNWYEFENGKIKGTTMLMDEYGEVMEERIDYFEISE